MRGLVLARKETGKYSKEGKVVAKSNSNGSLCKNTVVEFNLI